MSYEQLSEGIYNGRLAYGYGLTFGESESKGTPYARVHIQVTDGESEGEIIRHDFYLSPKTIEKSIKGLRALGFTGSDLAAFQDQSPDQVVEFTVEHQEYKEKMYAKIVRIGAAPKPIEKTKLDEMSKQFAEILSPPSPGLDPTDTMPAWGDDVP